MQEEAEEGMTQGRKGLRTLIDKLAEHQRKFSVYVDKSFELLVKPYLDLGLIDQVYVGALKAKLDANIKIDFIREYKEPQTLAELQNANIFYSQQAEACSNVFYAFNRRVIKAYKYKGPDFLATLEEFVAPLSPPTLGKGTAERPEELARAAEAGKA